MIAEATFDLADFANAFAEPLIIVSASGRVLHANRQAQVLFGAHNTGHATGIHELLGASPEKTREYLRLASQTSGTLPPSLLTEIDGAAWRWEWKLLRRAQAGQEAVVLVRGLEQSQSNAFVALNKRIEVLNRDVREWRRVGSERQALLARVESAGELHQAQAELLRTITDNVSTAIYLLDERGLPSYLNPAAEALFGYTLEEIQGRAMHEVLHQTESGDIAHDGGVCPLADSAPMGPFQDSAFRKDGARVPVMIVAAPVSRTHGAAGTVLEVRDISRQLHHEAEMSRLNAELVSTIDELRVASAAKDEFLALVSHEMKNPLTSVAGLSHFVEEHLADIPSHILAEHLAVIARDATRIAEIIENMLSLSRAEKDPPELEPISFAREVPRIVRAYSNRKPGRMIRIDVAPDLPVALGHPGWVEQVLCNLVSNAEKYSPPGSEIEIRVTADEGFICTRVLDRGVGFDPSSGESYFEPFVRSEEVSRRVPGLGLGLTVCRRLVAMMGGSVGLQARESGPGAEAWFTIPTLEQDAVDRE